MAFDCVLYSLLHSRRRRLPLHFAARHVGILLVSWLALVGGNALAADWSILLQQAPAGSEVSLVVEPLDNGPIRIHHRENRLQPPASTQKLFTALAAELALGSEYRFTTGLWRRGKQTGTRWQGDLLLAFSGAPDLSREQLGQLLDRLKAAGLNEIHGDLLLDDSTYDGYAWGNGWPWNNLGVCYSAPVPALILDHNCVAGSLMPTAAGHTARVYIPPFQPIEVASQALTVSREEQQRRHCELEVEIAPGNRYTLTGCISNARKRWPLNFAVNDIRQFAVEVIAAELKQRGIRLTGTIRKGERRGSDWQMLAQVQSAPLAQLLTTLLQESDNLYAESLLKQLGHQRFAQPGNFRNGSAAVKEVLAQQAGIALERATLRDGSGLSRDNLASAAQLAAVLRYLADHPQLATTASLPLSGEDGTLKYRRSVINPPLASRIRAKTGTVNGSTNLVGFIHTASDRHYLFALMVSGISLTEAEHSRLQSTPAEHPVVQFERTLLEWLYHHG